MDTCEVCLKPLDVCQCVECQRCEKLVETPVYDSEQLAWTGTSGTWCSDDCHQDDAEEADQRRYEAFHAG